MEVEDNPRIEQRSSTALERARNVSQALSDAARRARFSTRSRRAYASGGFRARRGARAARIALILSFLIIVAIPSALCAIYYGFIASDQYVAEAKFTVSGGEIPNVDGLGSFTGIPLVAIIQDTQIVTNYIQSRAALERLEQAINIRALYATPKADFLSRFQADKPIEKFLNYWKHKVDVSIKMPSGIVDLRIKAFTPDDAARITNAVLSISESLINELNDRMNRDAVTNAEQELDRASLRLAKARATLERTRNDEGLLDTEKTAESLNSLITETRAADLKLQQDYIAERKWVSARAPQMLTMKSRIDAMNAQIAELEAKLTSTQAAGSAAQPTLANAITKFDELELERKIDERLYAGATSALELARLTAENKLMYINIFVRPITPQEPQYPKRLLYTGLISLGLLAGWGALCGLALTIRNYMA